MVTSTPVANYQPSTAFQNGSVSTTPPEPKTNQVQPKQAPAADAQSANLNNKPAPIDNDRPRPTAAPTEDSKSSFTAPRGQNVDVKA
jgi:hypothetical protein